MQVVYEMKQRCELELLNGDKVAVFINPDKMYDLKEMSTFKWKFAKKFPFLEREEIRYVSFRLQDKYETMRDFTDPRLKVKCTLSELSDIIGFPLKRFTSQKLKSIIMNG